MPGATSFDVIAELRVPHEFPAAVGTQMDVARMVMMLLRLGVHPGIGSPVVANFPLASMPQRPDTEIWLRANEQLPRCFSVMSDATTITPEHAAWLAKTWPVEFCRKTTPSKPFAVANRGVSVREMLSPY